MKTPMRIEATAMGGTTWSLSCNGEFLGFSEAGTIGEDGQLVEDEEEIGELIIKEYDLPETAEVDIGF